MRIVTVLGGGTEALKATGATVEISDDIRKVLWTKFLFISASSSMGCTS